MLIWEKVEREREWVSEQRYLHVSGESDILKVDHFGRGEFGCAKHDLKRFAGREAPGKAEINQFYSVAGASHTQHVLGLHS